MGWLSVKLGPSHGDVAHWRTISVDAANSPEGEQGHGLKLKLKGLFVRQVDPGTPGSMPLRVKTWSGWDNVMWLVGTLAQTVFRNIAEGGTDNEPAAGGQPGSQRYFDGGQPVLANTGGDSLDYFTTDSGTVTDSGDTTDRDYFVFDATEAYFSDKSYRLVRSDPPGTGAYLSWDLTQDPRVTPADLAALPAAPVTVSFWFKLARTLESNAILVMTGPGDSSNLVWMLLNSQRLYMRVWSPTGGGGYVAHSLGLPVKDNWYNVTFTLTPARSGAPGELKLRVYSPTVAPGLTRLSDTSRTYPLYTRNMVDATYDEPAITYVKFGAWVQPPGEFPYEGEFVDGFETIFLDDLNVNFQDLTLG